jgi:hypothetical protein
MRLTIYGAGLAGLLAANMLRRYKPVVREFQSSLPHNHDALLRFRSDAVARATGIPFRKVRVQKGVFTASRGLSSVPSIADCNMYSMKVTGDVLDRSIGNLDPVDRWIAPPNLIATLADSLEIQYDSPMKIYGDSPEPIVSTIPMPGLMKLAGWELPAFGYRPVTVLTFDILWPKTEVYQTVYFPEIELLPYRVSITGSHVMIEITGEVTTFIDPYEIALSSLKAFGLPPAVNISDPQLKVQTFGKIVPIPENARKEFILAMSDRYNIYSVGRYATWRNILLDDVVRDIELVEGFIAQRDGYSKKISSLR